MKRIVPYIIFIILLAYLIIVFTFAATKMGEVTCRGVRVTVKDTTMNVFVGEEDILKMIKNGYGGILNQGIKTVNKSIDR